MTKRLTTININVKGKPLAGTLVYDEQGQATGYGDAIAILQTLGVPTVLSKDGALLVPLRRLAEVFNLQHAYTEGDHTFWLASKPLQPLPAEPVGADVRPWHPVTAPIAGGPGDRRGNLLERIIQQFKVAVNPRYRVGHQGKGETYCNIYVWDVTRALGSEIPHWVIGDGEPSSPGRGRELDANATILWLRHRGPDFNWRRVPDAELAHACAAAGNPVAATWYNPGGIGHVSMVRPVAVDPVRGIPIAQAGAANFDDGYLVDGFGSRGPIEYFVSR